MASSAMNTAFGDIIHLHQTLDALQGDISSTPADAAPELRTLESMLINATSRVRTLINSLSPINRLPPEILSHIFTFAGDGTYVDAHHEAHSRLYGPLGLGSAKGFVPLTEVCHRWRDILVHNSKFWSTIEDSYVFTKESGPIKPRNWTHFIHRNPDGPLHVQIRHDPTEEVLALLRESGTRVEDFQAAQVDGESFIRLVSFSADNLLACTLTYATDLGSTSLTLFNGHAPRLRTLKLYSCHFIPANVFPSLTHLMITFRGHERPSSAVEFSFADVLRLLDSCPSLEVLYYITHEHVHVKDLPSPGDIPQKVTLSRLRKLYVAEFHLDPKHSSGRFQVALCAHLDLPPECLVCIEPASIADFQHHARTLPSSLAAGDTLCLRVITKEKDKEHRVEDTMSVQVVDSRRSLGMRIEVGYDTVRSTEEAREEIRRVLSSSPLFGAITVIDLSRIVFAGLMRAPSILEEFVNLETLAVSNINGNIRALEMLKSRGAAPIAFPHLHTVALFRMLATQMVVVHDVIQSRTDAGYPLDRLSLVLVPCVHGNDRSPEQPADTQLDQIRRLVKQVTVVGSDVADDVTDDILPWRKLARKYTSGEDDTDYWRVWCPGRRE
ncbi:hypothetical protein C8Q80DRAFT_1266985 [Daedaleopsis nitida]|nr:hypothetical protein C8Q80DRAFT_1266985 [Daedaleopsis nitida]